MSMVAAFSASGSLVHTPFGPLKSGMPESVEMPAPVSTTIRWARPTSALARASSAPASRESPVPVMARPSCHGARVRHTGARDPARYAAGVTEERARGGPSLSSSQ